MIAKIVKSQVKRLFVKSLKSVLADREIQGILWEIIHRPLELQTRRAENIQVQLYKNAARETAQYVEQNMTNVHGCPSRKSLLELSLSKANIEGLYLEFGVATGKSINWIAAHTDRTVHGFDSFEGLPEHWFDKAEKGAYATEKRVPTVRNNVMLHIGPFEDTLPKFVAKYQEPAAFMHVDCDIYSSTRTVLDVLGEKIMPGTVIQFDEYFNYPGWKNHEYRAFQEFIRRSKLMYEYLGYNARGYSVAVLIKSNAQTSGPFIT